MSPNSLFVIQAATHLKGLAEKAKLNEKHVRIARIYKAKVATLTSERAELQGRAQHMSEEMERLKSDLKHTSSARARAESREVEVRSSLTTAEGELREARSELRALQSDLVEFQEGLKSTQGELQLAREDSLPHGASSGIFRQSCGRSMAIWLIRRRNSKLLVAKLRRARCC